MNKFHSCHFYRAPARYAEYEKVARLPRQIFSLFTHEFYPGKVVLYPKEKKKNNIPRNRLHYDKRK